MNFIDYKKEISFIIVVIFAIAIFFAFGYFTKSKDRTVSDELVENKKEFIDYFSNLDLEAKSVFVFDSLNNKFIYKKNENTQLPLASLTKLMTALVSDESIPEGTIITVKKEDISVEGDSGLREGERWTLKNLLDFTLMVSSNDGAHAIASVVGEVKPSQEGKTDDEIFIAEMNRKAREIGLTQTYFLSESGLDLNKVIGGAYGSARDMALLMSYIVNNNLKLLSTTRYADLDIKSKDYIHSVKNTNEEVETIPGVLGSKTGFTDLAGGNLVVAFDVGIGHPIIVSVLGSSLEGRVKDVKKLVNASIHSIANNNF